MYLHAGCSRGQRFYGPRDEPCFWRSGFQDRPAHGGYFLRALEHCGQVASKGEKRKGERGRGRWEVESQRKYRVQAGSQTNKPDGPKTARRSKRRPRKFLLFSKIVSTLILSSALIGGGAKCQHWMAGEDCHFERSYLAPTPPIPIQIRISTTVPLSIIGRAL